MHFKKKAKLCQHEQSSLGPLMPPGQVLEAYLTSIIGSTNVTYSYIEATYEQTMCLWQTTPH